MRIDLELVLWSVFDFMTIIPNLIMHWRNFRDEEEEETRHAENTFLHSSGSVDSPILDSDDDLMRASRNPY